MEAKGYRFASWKMTGCKFEVVFYPQTGLSGEGKATTFPLAASLAFAKANGIDTQEQPTGGGKTL